MTLTASSNSKKHTYPTDRQTVYGIFKGTVTTMQYQINGFLPTSWRWCFPYFNMHHFITVLM